MYKHLPTLDCQSCGNCEKDFHKYDEHNKDLGFCLRFKENVPLTEKNVSCWTDKENHYYKQLELNDQKNAKRKEHINIKKAKLLNLDFSDKQLTFF